MLHTQLSSGAGKIGQLVADVPSRLSLTSPQETKKTNYRGRSTLQALWKLWGGGLHEISVLLKVNPTDERTPIHVST
jgi:hypothetical protein